jgi:acyl-CoA synthetase (AMP-forming)/AMP-acid ligase II
VETTSSTIRSLPDLIRFNAIHNPHHVFCIQSNADLESTSITFLELAHAVERCCDWILTNVHGTSPAEQSADGSLEKSRPIALFMESDVCLFIYLAALLTLNIPVRYPSPPPRREDTVLTPRVAINKCVLLSIRLSASAILHLLDEAGSASIIVSDRTRPNVQNALAQATFEAALSNSTSITLAAPAAAFLDSPCSNPPLAMPMAGLHMVREDDRNVIILHSSGTTGELRATLRLDCPFLLTRSLQDCRKQSPSRIATSSAMPHVICFQRTRMSLAMA